MKVEINKEMPIPISIPIIKDESPEVIYASLCPLFETSF
jgi:hypothetical protein